MIVRRSLCLTIVLLAVVLVPRHAATFESIERPATTTAAPGVLIPTAAFFGNPTISSPRLSPDGKHIAFIFSKDDDQRVFARPVVGKNVIGLAGFSVAEARVREIAWANSHRLLLSSVAWQSDASGTNRLVARLSAVNVKRPRLKWLSEKWGPRGPDWPLSQERHPDRVIHLLRGERDNVLVSHLEVGDRTPSVSRMNVYSGRLRSVERARKGIGIWHADDRGSVLAAEALRDGPEGTQRILFARSNRKEEFQPVFEQPAGTASDFAFGDYGEGPGLFYVIANHEGRRALFELDTRTKALGSLVYAHPEFDVSGLRRSTTGRKVVGVEYIADAPEVAFLDDGARREQASIDYSLSQHQPGATTNRIISSTADGNVSIVEVSGATQPPVYYAYNRAKKEMNFVFEQRPDLAVDRLAEVSRIDIPNRTGQTLPAYLTRPREAGEHALPMIVVTHAGVGSRARAVFDPVVQFFASRGFAVLQVNHRGSDGYGRAFELVAAADPMASALEDIADAVSWATQQGIADGKRVGVFGEGSGGTIALLALASSPGLFRAGASYAAAVNDEVEAAVRAGSGTPQSRAKDIKAKVLVGHGVRDSRVPIEQVRAFVNALEEGGTSAELIELADEFSGIAHGNTRAEFYDRVLTFFRRHLLDAPTPKPAPNPANTSEPADRSAKSSGTESR